MIVALSHHPWSAKDECYNAPAVVGLRGTIDFRSNVQCGKPGVETPGSLLCLLDPGSVLDDSFTVLSTEDPRDAKPDGKTLDAIEALLGRRPRGDTLADCIADLLMTGCDPLGLDTCKPLMPTFERVLEVHLFGKVYERPFVYGIDPHTNAVQSVLQADFKAAFEAVQSGKAPGLHAEKVLDYWCDKYRISKTDKGEWGLLVPADLRDEIAGPATHATTITDNFDGADSDTIGNLLTWVEDQGDWDRLSNQVILSAASTAFCHNTSNLSGTDHYSQVSIVAQGTTNGAADRITGPSTRLVDGSNHYFSGLNNVAGGTTLRLYKRVAGTNTQLGTDGTVVVSLPQNAKTHSNGSTQTAYWNGSANANATATDSALTTGTLTGLWMRVASTTATVDNFEAADLGGGSSASSSPSTSPSSSPSSSRSSSPSSSPSASASSSPSSSPSSTPSSSPSASASSSPSASASSSPSASPSSTPSASASSSPSTSPSSSPSSTPSASPSTSPSTSPSASPSSTPSASTSSSPSSSPSPSASASASPSTSPSGEAATITIESNIFTRVAGGVNVDSNRLLQLQLTNADDVVFTFEETEVS